jgi:hypothetical protein
MLQFFILRQNSKSVTIEKCRCVSKVKMSPLTSELKYPHGSGKAFIESEAVTEVASHDMSQVSFRQVQA